MRNLRDVLDLVKLTEPTIFDNNQLLEMNDLIKYNDYYKNEAFKYIADQYPEFRQGRVDGKDYKPAQVPLNYAKMIVDQLAAWQFEKSIDFSCTSVLTDPKDPAEPSRSGAIEKDLYEIHKRNKMDVKLLQAATESNISGGIAFKLKYDLKKRYPRILIRNRIETFVVTEFDDYEEIIRVHFVAFQDDNTIWKQTFEMVGEVCYISEALFDTKDIKTAKEIIIPYQPLGNNSNWLNFLPVYIIANLAQLGETWGPSDERDLIPIIDEINKKYSDLSDSLKFDMFAITVFLNAKLPVDSSGNPSLKNKAGAAWAVAGLSPTDNLKPDVFKLQGTFNYTETLVYHINTLVSALFEFSAAVNISPEKITGLPALSGIALKLLFASIISKTNRKNTVWKEKLAEVYMGTLKLKQIYEGYDIPEDLNIEIITHIPIPANELEEVQIATAKLSAGLSSVETEMNKMGVENAQEEIAKMLAERIDADQKLNIDQRNNE